MFRWIRELIIIFLSRISIVWLHSIKLLFFLVEMHWMISMENVSGFNRINVRIVGYQVSTASHCLFFFMLLNSMNRKNDSKSWRYQKFIKLLNIFSGKVKFTFGDCQSISSILHVQLYMLWFQVTCELRCYCLLRFWYMIHVQIRWLPASFCMCIFLLYYELLLFNPYYGRHAIV